MFRQKSAAADKHATLQEGRLIRRASTKKGGKEVVKWGVVHCRDAAIHRPNYFEIHYDDGTTEVTDARGLRALRPLPSGTVRPQELLDFNS